MTDALDAEHLTTFIAAYQEVTPLKLGEPWAIPIMLRLGLIENLRRVVVLLGLIRGIGTRPGQPLGDRMIEVAEFPSVPNSISAVGDLAKSGAKLATHAFAEFPGADAGKSRASNSSSVGLKNAFAEDGFTCRTDDSD